MISELGTIVAVLAIAVFMAVMITIPVLWIIENRVRHHQDERKTCAEWVVTMYRQFETLTNQQWRQYSWSNDQHDEVWHMMQVLMYRYAGGTCRNFIRHDNWLTTHEHSFGWLNKDDGTATVATRSGVEKRAFDIAHYLDLSPESVSRCELELVQAGVDVSRLVELFDQQRKTLF